MRAIWSFVAIACLVLSSSTAVVAQKKVLWQGLVVPDHIAVYENSSTSGRIITTLGHGEGVDVILQITSLGDEWCRVSRAGASEPLGFVLCMNLQRGHFTQKQITHSSPGATKTVPIAAVVPASAQPTSSSTALTNKDVLDLHRAGLPEQVLVAKIKSSQCNFDTSPSQLSQFKSAGLADGVILAMVEAPAMQGSTSNGPQPARESALVTGDATIPASSAG